MDKNTYDDLFKQFEYSLKRIWDERRNDKMGEISCGCCMPPKDIIIKLVSKRLPKKHGKE